MTRDDVIRLAKEAGSDYYPGFPDTAFLQHFTALVLEEAARVCDEKATHCEKKAEEALKNGEYDEVIVIRSTAWQILTCGQAIRAMKPEVKT